MTIDNTGADLPPGTTQVATRLFGRLSIPVESVITFPQGLPGFIDARRFVLLDAGAPGLRWLQSLDEPALCFLTAPPAHILPGAWSEFPDALVIVTLPAGDCAASANMRAPLLIDAAARTGRQWIPVDGKYHTVHPFDLQSLLAPGSR